MVEGLFLSNLTVINEFLNQRMVLRQPTQAGCRPIDIATTVATPSDMSITIVQNPADDDGRTHSLCFCIGRHALIDDFISLSNGFLQQRGDAIALGSQGLLCIFNREAFLHRLDSQR